MLIDINDVSAKQFAKAETLSGAPK